MSMVTSIAATATSISMTNARQDVSISILKKAMNQSEENMSKILDIASVITDGTVDITV